jgi:hypothetical protein
MNRYWNNTDGSGVLGTEEEQLAINQELCKARDVLS